MNWKELLIIFGGIILIWWLDKQHQLAMIQMGYGIPQAPMYPRVGPEPMPVTPAAPYTPPMAPLQRVNENQPFWGSRGTPRSFGGGSTPMRLMLQIGPESYNFTPDSGRWGGSY